VANRLTLCAAPGLSRDAAARSAGIDPRSLRRWLAEGQGEPDALSAEAQLTLALNGADRKAQALDQAGTRLIQPRLAGRFGYEP
jgi:hypothetical protein